MYFIVYTTVCIIIQLYIYCVHIAGYNAIHVYKDRLYAGQKSLPQRVALVYRPYINHQPIKCLFFLWSPLLSWCNRTSEFKRRKRETSIHFIPRPYFLGGRGWHLGRGYPYIPMIHDIEISTNFLKNHRSPQQRRCLASHRHRWVFIFVRFFWRWRLRNEHQWFGMMVWHGLEMSGLNLPHFW